MPCAEEAVDTSAEVVVEAAVVVAGADGDGETRAWPPPVAMCEVLDEPNCKLQSAN
jgi:hypothetical protein